MTSLSGSQGGQKWDKSGPNGPRAEADSHRLDEDNVCQDFMGSYVKSFRFDDPCRLRFFDIMANRLNMRRAVRELALPQMDAVRAEVAELRNQVHELVTLLRERSGPLKPT